MLLLQQKRLGRNPGVALRDRFCDSIYCAIVYTVPMEKFGTRYPDGVEPSHTVVCYHKILFDADYLGRETPNFKKVGRLPNY